MKRFISRNRLYIICPGIIALILAAGVMLGRLTVPVIAERPPDSLIPSIKLVVTMTDKPMETPEPPARYILSLAERDTVERVVMAEAGAESYDGQILVAQCILNAAERDGITPSEALIQYKYTAARPEATESVKQAVSAVFDQGETVTDEPILYFYAPKLAEGRWHETQVFVLELGGHRFFKEEE